MEGFNCKIGKNLLKICMGDNYTDSSVVFREYVQNAIDAIYQAERLNITDHTENYVAITIANGNVTIEDRGIGVKQEEIGPTLINLGCSTKSTQDIGRYGIGRLSGANWCDRIVFETSYQGEPICSILTFDAKLARELIDNVDEQECSNIMDAVTSYESRKEEAEAHYFKVTLVNIKEELRNEETIESYLSSIAPVPYESTFYDDCQKSAFKHTPEFEELSKKEPICKIHLNGKPVYKPYRSTVYLGDSATKIAPPSFFKLTDEDYGDLAWGWYTINVEAKQMGENVKYKGLRLRAKNMAVGEQNYLIDCFKNPTDANYVIGEVFIMHDSIQPTGSRDGIISSPEFAEFRIRLKKKCNEIKQLYYAMSKLGSSALAPIIDNHIEDKRIKSELNADDITETKKAELKAEREKIKANTLNAKAELRSKLEAADKYENCKLITEAVTKKWGQKAKDRVKEYNKKASPDGKIEFINIESIISSVKQVENMAKEEAASPADGSGKDKEKTAKAPVAPKETDIYSSLGKSEHNLMKKVYRVIDSEKRLDDKTKENIKKKLAKKILGE